MNLNFPLKDVRIEITDLKRRIESPMFSDEFYNLNQNEFSMDVQNVAWFYVSDGNFISLVPYPGAEKTSIELYLNGSAYGALLHQRKILPLHGSCFRFEGTGVMVCGDAGAGKSSLTASFCINGAEFLTDDVTPLLFKEGNTYIWALSDRMKLWRDTLEQLNQEGEELQRIHPEMEKFYYPMGSAAGNTFSLDQVYILKIQETEAVGFEELSGSSKFIALRNEIYRFEYLKGMPENEPVYFENLIEMSKKLRVFIVKRPRVIKILELMNLIKENKFSGPR